MADETERKPWERLEGETAKAFAAFTAYLEMPTGERSYRGVGQKLGKSGALIDRWGTAHSWQSRVAQWDSVQAETKREVHLGEIADMSRRHATLAMAFQNKLVERLTSIDADDISPAQAAQWLEISVRVERIARGEAGIVISGPGLMGPDPLAFVDMDDETDRENVIAMATWLSDKRQTAAAEQETEPESGEGS